MEDCLDQVFSRLQRLLESLIWKSRSILFVVIKPDVYKSHFRYYTVLGEAKIGTILQ